MSIDLALGDVAVEIERHRALLADLQQVILDLIEDDDGKEDAWTRVYLQEFGE